MPGQDDTETPTIGSTEPPPPDDARRPPGPTPAQTPNGWYAGPTDDPDRYELLGEGLVGGEGVLFRARYRGQLASPLPFAVKALHRPADAGPEWPSPVERRRWQDQAALLRHRQLPHMVGLSEVFAGPAPHPQGEDPDAAGPEVAYAVMEWVEGPTLAELVRGSAATPATLGQRLRAVSEIAEALGALHSHTRSDGNPSLHRDVKPTNCIVHPQRGVVLVDLSTMRLVADGFDPAGLHSPGYSAPEVLAAPHRPPPPRL